MQKAFEDMTLEELVAENDRLWQIRQQFKALQLELQPFLDAAWAAHNEEQAAKADPALQQTIGEIKNG